LGSRFYFPALFAVEDEREHSRLRLARLKDVDVAGTETIPIRRRSPISEARCAPANDVSDSILVYVLHSASVGPFAYFDYDAQLPEVDYVFGGVAMQYLRNPTL
jgi:hypothetical protein